MPFRHTATFRPIKSEEGVVSITFRLSALSAHRVSWSYDDGPFKASQLPFGSVPFRHDTEGRSIVVPIYKSQLPFGSVPFRHVKSRPSRGLTVPRGLNYLSAQCPFGTDEITLDDVLPEGVSITFRLSALSAQMEFIGNVNVLSTSQLPFGSVPFRHDIWDALIAGNVSASQLPFGSVPFRHCEIFSRRRKGVYKVPLKGLAC